MNILLSGCGGKMGKKIIEAAQNDDSVKIVAGVDAFTNETFDFPVFASFNDVNFLPDVIIDFSHPNMLNGLLEFSVSKKIPTVIATTGFTNSQIESINDAAKHTAIFFTFNMSLGINLLVNLAKTASNVLGNDFDIEIIEKHHNQKIDAPSGTAIMLANSINSVFNDKKVYEYDRHSKREKRKNNEIGIHSVRGGTIVGEHEVIFAGNDEIISLSHTALSKAVFATGALRAAKYISVKSEGIFDMSDML